MAEDSHVEENSLSDAAKIENEFAIDIGLEIERLVITANKASQGLIITACTSSMMCLAILSFHLASSLDLTGRYTDENKVIFNAAHFFTVLMYLVRLHILMKSGQILGNRIRQSKRKLEDIMISHATSSGMNEENCNKLSVLRKRLEVYQYSYPIAPYSIFSLSTRTYFATLATVITYIVILLKLRGLGASNTCPVAFFNNSTTVT